MRQNQQSRQCVTESAEQNLENTGVFSEPKLKESSSGLNDKAFESDRKKTGKFKVEHLNDAAEIN